ncbi:MAG TPA: PQQ-binding-like beta-propeller repeat protein [Xanthobacteraceae bacterium]
MNSRLIRSSIVLFALGAGGGVTSSLADEFTRIEVGVGDLRSGILSLFAPPGAVATETNPNYKVTAAPAPTAPPSPAAADWPSYNKTLTSERFSDLSQINTKNVAKLKVLCTYDTGRLTAFETGLIMVEGALIGTTEFDIFSIDPSTCAENWRTHEEYPAYILPTNRGAVYLDGMLFRGTQDGRVLAYEFKTGKRLWEATISDAKKNEDVPAAPIAWNGLVFIGNAGGDFKGGKGHVFALDAKTGKIVWQFFLVPKTEGDIVRGPEGASPLDTSTWKNIPGAPISGGGTWTSTTLDPATGLLYVPVGNPAPAYDNSVRQGDNLFTGSVVVLDAKTGAYKNHFQLVPRDWHDWDVTNPPALIKTAGGRRLMAVSVKDGYLYGFDLADNKLLYQTPVTRRENAEEPFSVDKDVHFCPGAGGGEMWNSPAYDPATNLILTPEIEWCETVRLMTREEIAAAPLGQPWTGEKTLNPFNVFGKMTRADGEWAGWLYAADADTGVWKWRLKSNYPLFSAVTPTAGGLVFFGDMGGNFYALDAATGHKLWGEKIGGAIAAGVITYTVNGAQKVAVATGYVSPTVPVEIRRANIQILGLEGGTGSQ